MVSAYKMPEKIRRKIEQKAPIVTISENSGRRYGDFTEYDIDSRGYQNIIFYIQKGLSSYSKLIKGILKPILQMQGDPGIKYRIIPFTFGIADEPFYKGKYFDLRYSFYNTNILNIIKFLAELSGDEKSQDQSIIPLLFTKSHIGGKRRIKKNEDLLIVIGRKDQVYFDESIREEVEKFRKQILFVEIENENVNWYFHNYEPKFIIKEGVNEMCIPNQLRSICEKTACNLISMYPSGNSNMLIFPHLRGYKNEIRVSEQEARFCFVSEITKQNELCYAVEVPTVNRYSDFSTNPKVYNEKESGGRSGAIDLSLFIENKIDKPYANIEFKSGQPKLPSIKKDILKLLYEPCENNIFFHVLKHSNQGTLKALIKKFNVSINEIRNQSAQYPITKNSKILFFIVILEDIKSKEISKYASHCFDFSEEEKMEVSSFTLSSC